MINQPIIILTNSCWHTIKRNLIEKFENEAIGDLVGKKEGNEFILINAYPWVTAKTNSREAYSGDDEARKRVIEHDRSMLRAEVSDFSIIGNYHTHPYIKSEKDRSETRSYIHNEDIEFFRSVMRESLLEESVQIIATVMHKSYGAGQQLGEFVKSHVKKLSIESVYTTEKNVENPRAILGYSVTLAGYLVNYRNFRELKVKGVNAKVVERKSW